MQRQELYFTRILNPWGRWYGSSALKTMRVWIYITNLLGTLPQLTVRLLTGPTTDVYTEVANYTFTTAPAVVKLWEGTPSALFSLTATEAGTVTAYNGYIEIEYDTGSL
jgi:hypothetical protein